MQNTSTCLLTIKSANLKQLHSLHPMSDKVSLKGPFTKHSCHQSGAQRPFQSISAVSKSCSQSPQACLPSLSHQMNKFELYFPGFPSPSPTSPQPGHSHPKLTALRSCRQGKSRHPDTGMQASPAGPPALPYLTVTGPHPCLPPACAYARASTSQSRMSAGALSHSGLAFPHT